MGRAPDYVDGHQHVHQLPVIREALLSTLVQRYNKAKPWLRSTVRAVAGLPWRGSRSDRKAWLIETLGGRSLRRTADRLGLTTNTHLLGIYDFGSADVPFGQRMERWLDGVQHGDALLCHPATSTDSTDPIAACRRQEFAYLASDEFDHALRVRRIRVARLSRSGPGHSSQNVEPAAATPRVERA